MKNQFVRFCAWVCLALFTSLSSGYAQIQEVAKILPPNPSPNMRFGEAAMDKKGDRFLIGVPKAEKAFLYQKQNSGYQLKQTFTKPTNLPVMAQITDPNKVSGHVHFGQEVCLGPGHVLVGYEGYAFEMSEKAFKRRHVSPGMVDYRAQSNGTYIQHRVFPNFANQAVSSDSLLFIAGDYSDGIYAYSENYDNVNHAVFRFYKLDSNGDYVQKKEVWPPFRGAFHRKRNRIFTGISPGGKKISAYVNSSWLSGNMGEEGLFREHFTDSYFFDNVNGNVSLEDSVKGYLDSSYPTCRPFANEILANNDQYAVVRKIDWSYNFPSDTTYVIWKYDSNSGSWAYDQNLNLQGGQATGPHISDVAMTEDHIFVGNQAYPGGRVDVLQLGGGFWQLVDHLLPTDNQAGDRFGMSLAVDSTGLAVGAPGVDANGTDVGAVYLYEFNCKLPPSFSLSRVGYFLPPVSACFESSSGRLELMSGGEDIYANIDGFAYVYQPISGNAAITVSIRDIPQDPYWNLAGVMFRESLQAHSKNVFLGLNGANSSMHQTTLQHRSSTGGNTQGVMGPSMAKPGWLRLIRSGNFFDAWTSINGFYWDYLGRVNVPMNNQVLVGMAVATPYNVGQKRFEFGDINVSSLNPRFGQREKGKELRTIPEYRESMPEVAFTEDYFHVSPNVFDNFIRVEAKWEKEAAAVDLQVMDTRGRTLFHKTIAEPGKEWEGKLALPELSPGLYILQFESGEFRKSARIIKK